MSHLPTCAWMAVTLMSEAEAVANEYDRLGKVVDKSDAKDRKMEALMVTRVAVVSDYCRIGDEEVAKINDHREAVASDQRRNVEFPMLRGAGVA